LFFFEKDTGKGAFEPGNKIMRIESLRSLMIFGEREKGLRTIDGSIMKWILFWGINLLEFMVDPLSLFL